MKIRTISTALAAFALCTAIFSCTKTEDVAIDQPIEKTAPGIPAASRIIIHFGTATQMGCMYSFSNCIWIGWGTEALNYQDRMALQFGEGDAAGEYFGQYFPLTGDFVVDAATAAELGIPEQVIPAGFYALRDVASGQATGKRVAQFGPEFSYPVASPINADNPQDNLGQLHNLAVQVVLHENRDALKDAAIIAVRGGRCVFVESIRPYSRPPALDLGRRKTPWRRSGIPRRFPTAHGSARSPPDHPLHPAGPR